MGKHLGGVLVSSKSFLSQMSNEKRAAGSLGCIGDLTTQLYGDDNQPL